MRSRMTDAQLAKLKGKAQTSNEINKLATAANGHGVTSVERRKAQAALEQQLGKKGAAKAQETALQRAGAKPKGLGRFFG